MSSRNMTLTLRLQAEATRFVSGLGQADMRLAALEKTTKQASTSFTRLERASVSASAGMINAFDKASTRIKAITRTITGAVAAYQAAKMVLEHSIKQPMDYDRRLAHMANTAFSDRNTQGRIAGKKELNDAIVGSVRTGGGSREDAAAALDQIIASGTVSVKSAMAMLPEIQKRATATGADPSDLANIAIRAVQNGLTEKQLPELFDKAQAAGQAGGFELKDMARWLPQQMAVMGMSGMRGMPGIERILASNQLGVMTAGTKDEAGNNLVNLLAKINSSDTALDAKRLGINLPGYLAKKRLEGTNSLDAFVELADNIASRDKRFAELKKKAATANGGDKAEAYAGMADILQGSAIGRIVQDRQALMQLLAEMNNREYRSSVEKRMANSRGEGDRSFATVESTASFQTERFSNEKAIGMQTAFDESSVGIGGFMSVLADAAQQFPNLTASVMGATVAIGAMAAAAAAFGAANILTGNKPGGLPLPGGPGLPGTFKTTGALLGGIPLSKLRLLGWGAAATAGGVAAGSFGAGYELGNTEFVGKLVLKVMEAFGSKDAAMALNTMKSEEQKVDVGGKLVVELPDGMRIAKWQPNNQLTGINVHSGPYMSIDH